MARFTKITASIGPSSESKEVFTNMIKAGVNVCRLNFSHDTGDVQGAKIDMIRSVSAELGKPVAIMIDIQGPKHRIGVFETENHYPLKVGQKFILDSDPTPGNETRVQLPDSDVMRSLSVGDKILLNDGKIELRVDAVFDDKIETTVIRGNEIWSRRGFNLPDTDIDTEILTPKDKADLEYAITKNPDWVAVSFVQRAEDIAFVRDFITQRTSHPIKIIAKMLRWRGNGRLFAAMQAIKQRERRLIKKNNNSKTWPKKVILMNISRTTINVKAHRNTRYTRVRS